MKNFKIFFVSIILSGYILMTTSQSTFSQENSQPANSEPSKSVQFTPSITVTPPPSDEPKSTPNNYNDAICFPDVYPTDPEICNPLGPSEYLTDLAKKGLHYPPLPFISGKVDENLSVVPYQYAKLNVENSEVIPLYATFEDAEAGTNPIEYLSGGTIRYVSFTNRIDSGSGHFVQSKKGVWLRASPAAVSSTTLGRTFKTTPAQYFGWVFEGLNPYMKPDFNSGVNNTVYYNREDVLPILDIVEGKDTTWYQVGENQWLDRIHFRAALFNTTPPEGIPGGRWIEVDLYQQVVMVYEDYSLVYAAMIASGMKPFYTQPGIFQIYEKKNTEDMTGSFEADKSDYYYLEDVPFTMYFDQARAFHGAYWRAWYGFEQSHGCINMSIGDAHWLFDWAEVGDYTYIHDPSGVTPTDPSYYGQGGA